MAEVMSEQRRILELLASGQLTVDEAAELLEAVFEPPLPPKPPRPHPLARQLHIRIETDGDAGAQQARISVNVPLGLAKFASKLLPADAKGHLERQGVDLQELLAAIDGDIPEGRLIDIDAKQDNGAQKAKIVIEVV